MHILINQKEAVLKKGASFDYIAENRFFTGADSYTLSITFPLKGCKENLAIFGHINRKDNNLSRLLLECEIHDKNFHAYDSVNIVEISDTEVKTQFLAGKSVLNYASELDEVYINELTIGPARDEGHFDCRWYFATPGRELYTGHVSLPWVNNTSGNMQNKLSWASGVQLWYYAGTSIEEDAALSCQYFLIYVLQQILDYCHYSYDISALTSSCYRYLVIFNTFPYAWRIDEWALALPHWTVTEFLEQIELFTNGRFSIDRKQKKVTFRFNTDLLNDQEVVTISDVVDEHQVEISDKENTNDTYLEQINLKYADADHQMQKYYSCEWAINTIGRIWYNSFANLKSAITPYLTHTGNYGNISYYNRLLYAKDIDTYFVLRCYRLGKDSSTGKTIHYMRLQPVNVFAPRNINRKEDAQVTELSIVPVCIDHCDMVVGDCVFLECGTYGDVEDNDENQTLAVNTLIDGEPEKKEEYFDKIYVGFWDGYLNLQNWGDTHYYPIPWIDNVYFDMFSNYNHTHMDEQEDYSMRLKGSLVNYRCAVRHKIDQSIKFTFKFLVKDGTLPDVQSIFYIHGKRYLAEKITATFTEDGMSQLVKMVAYRML